jgi:hypothetical protein
MEFIVYQYNHARKIISIVLAKVYAIVSKCLSQYEWNVTRICSRIPLRCKKLYYHCRKAIAL